MTTRPDPSRTSSADPQPTLPLPPEPPARGRRVNRRMLIGAGAGLLVGAGATQAANALASSSPSGKPGPPSPAEMLMTEHGVLKRLLLVYQNASAQLAAGQTPPAQAITATAQMITDYIEGFHEGLEEAYIFPRVRPVHPSLVHTLLVQHDRGRHLTAAIFSLSSQNIQQGTTRSSLRRYLDMFVTMYAHHEAWEDTVLFPTIRAVTTPQTLDQLSTRFVDLQSAQYGDNGYNEMLGRVSNIEQQLAIADLAAFTPPEINPPYA